MKYNPESLGDRITLATALETMLTKANFIKVSTDATEDIYEMAIPQVPGVSITVYTSIFNGAARTNGADAIRVAAVYKRKDGGYRQLFSETRINRTGDLDKIVVRTHQRMRDAYVMLRDSFKGENLRVYTCRCGAPNFLSKSKNLVCAETCWVK